MKIIDAALPEETVHLAVEQSPVWEWIVGIAGYTHGQLRLTFEMDDEWTQDAKAMPASLLDSLAKIEETNLWYGLLLLQNKFGAKSVDEFSSGWQRFQRSDFTMFYCPIVADLQKRYGNRRHNTLKTVAGGLLMPTCLKGTLTSAATYGNFTGIQEPS
ncbi:hypothetical protein [Planococcus sp. MB-3u-03]|uniref:hypothetical protein n=1 Tax=Planococcus sp. MB-3u-03 TaxID=2058136 RepID=UPI001E65C83F|nr:hypothetical protein [Planococcus sp. MB-3u-03]